MKFNYNLLLVLVFAITANLSFAQETKKGKTRTLIVMFDGLRPDYITEENMPNLYKLKKEGSYGKHNHSVFPTVTRVNSASYATGSYPQQHGLLGNSVFFPEVNKTKSLNTGNASELIQVADATSGKLLHAVSLGEILEAKGKKLMVFSSGSTGQAYLQNHKLTGGGVVNPEFIEPESLKKEVIASFGEAPAYAKPNTGRHKWMMQSLFKWGLIENGPDVVAVWFSDPDGTAHALGLGSPEAMESIKIVDEEFGKIINTIEANGWKDSFNILVSTDHGFVTNVGKESLSDFLIKQGLKESKESDDVVLAGGAIYVKDHNAEKIKKIVDLLQEQEWIGAIFTKPSKPGNLKGSIEGTLSYEAIHWNHEERAADILVAENWDDRENKWGYKGTSFSRGVAGHGGSSPYEIHIPLIASGPGIKKSFEGDLPTSNVDIVPTVLHLQGIAVPSEMDGRIISEILVNPATAKKQTPKKERIETSVKKDWGTYHLVVERTILGDKKYLDFTKVTRTFKTAEAK